MIFTHFIQNGAQLGGFMMYVSQNKSKDSLLILMGVFVEILQKSVQDDLGHFFWLQDIFQPNFHLPPK